MTRLEEILYNKVTMFSVSKRYGAHLKSTFVNSWHMSLRIVCNDIENGENSC